MPRFKSVKRSRNKSKHRHVLTRKRTWLSVILLGFFGLLASCSGTRTLMQTAPSTPKGASATPPISAASLNDWRSQIPSIQSAFETHIYGPIPKDLLLKETGRGQIDGVHFESSARLETRKYDILKNGMPTGRNFGLVLVIPDTVNGPTPLIIMQNFCPNNDVIRHPEIPVPPSVTFSCSGDGIMSNVFSYFFGRYITTPPITEIMNRGYALAVMYPSEFVPDNATRGLAVLDHVFADQSQDIRTGALAAWAAQFSLVSNVLEMDTRFGPHITYGHSRFGKSALLAAAFDPDIDGVIAHQSGTGGASLTRDKPGETLKDITEGYPFWFNRKFASYAGNEDALPVDQHHLLALIAPRPVLLGNAKRDVWSDPNGAFRAAQAASEIYKLYGKPGLSQDKLTDFNKNTDIAFWIRPGTHGVVKEDWPAFLDFLDAQFKPTK